MYRIYISAAKPTVATAKLFYWAPPHPDNDWQEYKDSFLFSYASWTKYDDLDAAKEACLANYKCNGITQVDYNFK